MTKTPKEKGVEGEGGLDDESPTSAHLGNDHEFIIKEYTLSIGWQSHESLCSK